MIHQRIRRAESAFEKVFDDVVRSALVEVAGLKDLEERARKMGEKFKGIVVENAQKKEPRSPP